jgi:uncharacterized protein (TIGR00255 family)
MTGFGKITTELPNRKITVEVKSLNSKQLDINTRMPAAYRDREMEIRSLIAHAVERGKVDFILNIDTIDAGLTSRINMDAMVAYHKQIGETAERLQLDPPSDWFRVLLRLPDVVRTEAATPDPTEWEAVEYTIREALGALVAFRLQEGAMLENIFRTKIAAITQLAGEVDAFEPERLERVKARLMEALKKAEVKHDANRFEQELIYFIERMDVSEEKARLDNHLRYFLESLPDEASPGRKLGFIAQEIGREINTLGSKSSHAEMQHIVVRMKDELEQIKEQIANVL